MTHTFFESLEMRQLLAADIAVDMSALYFAGVKNKTTPTQTITIRNVGTNTLTIKTGGLSIGGMDYNKFALSSPPALPKNISPGTSLAIKVVFKPTVAGVKGATLSIKTNDPDHPTMPVTLRGLGTDGLYDTKEPSLQRIFNLFQMPIKTGDTNIATNTIEGSGIDDSVDMQALAKAGDGPVTFELLAAYTGAATPAGKFGVYTPGSPETMSEMFVIPAADVQTIKPHAIGTTSFDPADQPFGLYSSWPTQTYQNVFSENSLNTFEANDSARGKYRFYPLKNTNGTVVPNAFVVAIEEAKNADFQDAVMIVCNVKKYVPPVLPPVLPPADPYTPDDSTNPNADILA